MSDRFGVRLNFYEHHISDYQRKTAHLSLAEHGAYLLMLQAFYSTERPLPADRKVLFKLLRAYSATERRAVNSIVEQFWIDGPDGLTNPRADEVLAKYRKWLVQQKENGNRGGRPTKTHGLSGEKPNGNPSVPETETQTKPMGGDRAHACARVLLPTSHLDEDLDVDTHPPQPLPGREGRVWGNGNKSRSGWTPPKTQDEIEREEAARDANG